MYRTSWLRTFLSSTAKDGKRPADRPLLRSAESSKNEHSGTGKDSCRDRPGAGGASSVAVWRGPFFENRGLSMFKFGEVYGIVDAEGNYAFRQS
jgi:hypothetical protein